MNSVCGPSFSVMLSNACRADRGVSIASQVVHLALYEHCASCMRALYYTGKTCIIRALSYTYCIIRTIRNNTRRAYKACNTGARIMQCVLHSDYTRCALFVFVLI